MYVRMWLRQVQNSVRPSVGRKFPWTQDGDLALRVPRGGPLGRTRSSVISWAYGMKNKQSGGALHAREDKRASLLPRTSNSAHGKRRVGDVQ